MKQGSIIIIIFILWGCANRIAPTGGPKDEEPPVMVRSLPESGQKNYKDRNVEIEFNEFITLKNLKEQLIITPRIDFEYEYKFKKKTVFLEFDEPFADSTTYTLNFREGVVDITENQPARNLQIAFSTGNLLDTLEILGSINDMFTHEPIADATVGLYLKTDTLNIFTGPPYYFAKTDDTGQFHFRNIKDGEYRIYAFKDGNKNLICQSASEAYAFQSATIALDTTIVVDTLFMEHMNIDTLALSRVRPSGRYFNVLANKYITDASLQASNDSTLYYHFNEDHDGLVVYNSFPIKDSLAVYVTLQDSLLYMAKDTFYLQFPETSRRPEEFKVSFGNLEASLESAIVNGAIKLTKPLKEIRLDSIFIYYDSATQYSLKENFTYRVDSLNNQLNFSFPAPKAIIDTLTTQRKANQNQESSGKGARQPQAKYKLTLPKGTMLSIEQDTSALLEKEIVFNDPTKTGVITGNITTNYSSYFIQLLDSKFAIVQTSGTGQSFKFSNIKPGEYFIRILIDENDNGRWDHSDIRVNREAEPIIIYQDETGNNKTAVRANWEITVDLKF